MPSRCSGMDDANNSITLGALIVGVANPYKLTDDDFAKVKAEADRAEETAAQLLCGLRRRREPLRPERHQADVFHGRAAGAGPRRRRASRRRSRSRRRGAVGWLDCWELSAGVKDSDLAHAWINACLDTSVGKVLTEKLGYGNTTNLDGQQGRRPHLWRQAVLARDGGELREARRRSGTRSRRADAQPSLHLQSGRDMHSPAHPCLRRLRNLMPLATISPQSRQPRRRA